MNFENILITLARPLTKDEPRISAYSKINKQYISYNSAKRYKVKFNQKYRK